MKERTQGDCYREALEEIARLSVQGGIQEMAIKALAEGQHLPLEAAPACQPRVTAQHLRDAGAEVSAELGDKSWWDCLAEELNRILLEEATPSEVWCVLEGSFARVESAHATEQEAIQALNKGSRARRFVSGPARASQPNSLPPRALDPFEALDQERYKGPQGKLMQAKKPQPNSLPAEREDV